MSDVLLASQGRRKTTQGGVSGYWVTNPPLEEETPGRRLGQTERIPEESSTEAVIRQIPPTARKLRLLLPPNKKAIVVTLGKLAHDEAATAGL